MQRPVQISLIFVLNCTFLFPNFAYNSIAKSNSDIRKEVLLDTTLLSGTFLCHNILLIDTLLFFDTQQHHMKYDSV